MSEQDETQAISRHHPARDDQEAWKASWKEQGQPWRTEPEVDPERQQQLLVSQATHPDIEKGIYPFKGIRLSRADIEWLVAMQQETTGQHHGHPAGRQKHLGLDLRGADLSQINLSGLPLPHLRAGLSLQEGRHATVEQSQAAAANLRKADLSSAHLQQADLSWVLLDQAILLEAHLEGADLGKASLKHAILAGTHLQGADLTKAHLQGATLLEAHVEGAYLQGAYLEGANLLEAHLEGAKLFGAHLEAANLIDVHVEGKALPADELKRLRQWVPRLPAILPAADLRGVFFDSRTNLLRLNPGNEQYGFISLADVHWNGVNLTVVEWKQLKRLGDEDLVHRQPMEAGEEESEGEQYSSDHSGHAIAVMLRAQEVSDVVISYVSRSPVLMKRLRERLERERSDEQQSQQAYRLERYQAAVRANRQLAVVLRSQGLNEAADRFAYRAQVLQKHVLRLSGMRSFGSYLFSSFLDVLAGYGYRPARTLLAYLLTITCFALAYYALGQLEGPPISLLVAAVMSIVSFHGRGLFPGGFAPTIPMAVLGACEAIIGLTIEISFIATFTQRYFGK